MPRQVAINSATASTCNRCRTAPTAMQTPGREMHRVEARPASSPWQRRAPSPRRRRTPSVDNIYSRHSRTDAHPTDEYTCPHPCISPFLSKDLGLPPTLHFFSHLSESQNLADFDDLPHKRAQRKRERARLASADSQTRSTRKSASCTRTRTRQLRARRVPWHAGEKPRWDSSHHVSFSSTTNEEVPSSLREYFPRQAYVPPASLKLHMPSYDPLGHMKASMFQAPVPKRPPSPRFHEDILAKDPLQSGPMGALRQRHLAGGTMREKASGTIVPWNDRWNAPSYK